jgi:hypothetical protein
MILTVLPNRYLRLPYLLLLPYVVQLSASRHVPQIETNAASASIFEATLQLSSLAP